MADGLGGCWDWVAAVGLWVAGVGALDGLGVVGWAGAEGDLDLPAFLLFGLGDPDLEHAAVKVGLHSVWVDAVGEGERAGKAAERALEPVVALLVVFVLDGALAGDGEHVVLELDVDVVVGEAG